MFSTKAIRQKIWDKVYSMTSIRVDKKTWSVCYDLVMPLPDERRLDHLRAEVWSQYWEEEYAYSGED